MCGKAHPVEKNGTGWDVCVHFDVVLRRKVAALKRSACDIVIYVIGVLLGQSTGRIAVRHAKVFTKYW